MSILGFHSSTRNIITSIVSTLLDKPGARSGEFLEDRGILFRTGVLIEFTVEVCDERLDWDAREATKSKRFYYLAFAGNTCVFVANRDNGGPGCGLKGIHNLTEDDWINLGNHDSCWRDSVDSWFSEIMGEMCDEVNAGAMVVELEATCDIGFAGRLWQMVEMTIGQDPERDSYWRKLVNIKHA